MLGVSFENIDPLTISLVSLLVSMFACSISVLGYRVSRASFKRDKGELVLRSRLMMRSNRLDNRGFISKDQDDATPILILSVANVGRRPAKLKGVFGGSYGHSPVAYHEFMVNLAALTDRVLDEGEDVEVEIPVTTNIKDLLARLHKLYIFDSRGLRADLSATTIKEIAKIAKSCTSAGPDVDSEPIFLLDFRMPSIKEIMKRVAAGR